MKKIYLIFSLLFSLIFIGCKPTEKNYKSAYDAALGKRQAAMADMNPDIAVGSFQSTDGPQLKVIDGVEIYLLNTRIKPCDDNSKLLGNYNVAVGTYKMSTNCRAQAQALREEGYSAFPAQEPDGMYFTIAASFSSLSEAVKFYKEYKKDKNRVYVGLPDAPVIIYSPL